MLHQLSEPGGGKASGAQQGSGEETNVTLETNDPVLEALALQRLKELAPLALFAGQLLCRISRFTAHCYQTVEHHSAFF